MINNNNLYDVEKLAGQPVVVIDGTAFPVSVVGSSSSGGTEFYKCAAVSGLEDAYSVSGAGTEAVNGNYLKTGQTYSGQDIWKHETADYYMFFDNVNAYPNRWIIADNCPPNSFTTLYALIVTTDNPAQPGWSYSQGLREPPTVSKTQIRTGEDTWSGYKAIFADGKYSFEDTLTEGLIYSIIKPEIGVTYSADALITASYVYSGMPDAYVNLPLTTNYLGTVDGVETDFSSGVVGSLSFADGALKFPGGGSYLNLPGVTTDLLQGDFTIVLKVMQAVDGRTAFIAAENDCYIGIDDNMATFNMWAGAGGWDILQADYKGNDNSGCGSIARVIGEEASLAYVHDGSSWRLYVNGELSVKKERSGNIGKGVRLRLGAWGGGSFNLNGTIRGFKLYREALPDALIKMLTKEEPEQPDNGDSGNTPDSPDNGNDTPSDKTYLYTVSGAGTAEANGDYWETGDGTYTNGTCTMFFESASGDWYLGADPTAPYYYRMGGNPLGNWTVFKGTAPAPTVVEYAG